MDSELSDLYKAPKATLNTVERENRSLAKRLWALFNHKRFFHVMIPIGIALWSFALVMHILDKLPPI